MLSAASNKGNLTQTGLRVKEIYWFMYQNLLVGWASGWFHQGSSFIFLWLFLFHHLHESAVFWLLLSSWSKVMPVIPGVTSKQIAYSRQRENLRCWIPGRNSKLWAGWSDQFWEWTVLQREGFTNWLRSIVLVPGDGIGLGILREHGCSKRGGVEWMWEESTTFT